MLSEERGSHGPARDDARFGFGLATTEDAQGDDEGNTDQRQQGSKWSPHGFVWGEGVMLGRLGTGAWEWAHVAGFKIVAVPIMILSFKAPYRHMPRQINQ